MDAVILAAGYGSRLSEKFASKPLAPVCGVALIEISIRQLMRAGVTRFIVVVGHRAEELETALDVVGDSLGVEIVTAKVADHSLPNGHSVIAGAQIAADDFLLVMADHILSDRLIATLVDADMQGRDAILAIDRQLNSPLIDPDDATWVATDDSGAIRHIGKHLSSYDAVDCGAFRANGNLACAIKTSIADGKAGSLSDGMQVLADQGRAGTIDIADAWWIDVDDAHAHRLAEEQLPEHIGWLGEIGAGNG